MSTSIILNIPDKIYKEIQDIAQNIDKNVSDVLLESFIKVYKPSDQIYENDPMLVEVQAYERLHPMLVKEFLGQYVAIREGMLVDHDFDPVTLLMRVREKFPNQTVMRRKVEQVATPILQMRHPTIKPIE